MLVANVSVQERQIQPLSFTPPGLGLLLVAGAEPELWALRFRKGWRRTFRG